MKYNYDLDERLIDFAVAMIDILENPPKTFAGNHIARQFVRSGTAPALNYGEAQGAGSRNDFIHKMKVSAKEPRETYNCLRVINKKKWQSSDQLMAIIMKTIS